MVLKVHYYDFSPQYTYLVTCPVSSALVNLKLKLADCGMAAASGIDLGVVDALLEPGRSILASEESQKGTFT